MLVKFHRRWVCVLENTLTIDYFLKMANKKDPNKQKLIIGGIMEKISSTNM